jgi:MYXO-CTERM domain-containing protein
MIKLVSLFVLGSGMLMAMPPIPDLPSADTGTFSDTGSEPDTGSATDPEGTTGDNNTYSASQLANEKGGGCSVTAASQGSWLFGLFGLLALGRRKGE